MRLSFLVFGLLLQTASLKADTFTWNAGNTSVWSSGSSWVGGVAPSRTGNDSIVFDESILGVGVVSRADGLWSVDSVTLVGSGSSSFSVYGDALSIGSGGVISNSPFFAGSYSDLSFNNLQIELRETQVWQAVGAIDARQGTITGAGGIIKTGTASLTLGYANSYTGPTVVKEGAVVVQGDDSFGAVGTAVTLDGGTLAVEDSATLVRNFTVAVGGGHIQSYNPFTTTFSGTFSGVGELHFGSGLFALSGTNTNTGGTFIDVGAVTVSSAGKLGPGEIHVKSSLALTSAANLQNGSLVSLEDGAVLGLNSADLDPSTLLKADETGAGILALNVANYGAALNLGSLGSGRLSLGSQTQAIYSASTLGVGAGNIYRLGGAKGELTISGHDNVLTGSASLEIGGAGNFSGGKVILSNANNYTGKTTINAGTLQLGASGVIPDDSQIILNGGSLATGGFSETVGALQLTANSSLDFGSGTSFLAFGDSRLLEWTGTLTLSNFTIGVDTLKFGSNASALTADQLARLVPLSQQHYTASLTSDGTVLFVAVPEPEPLALALVGAAAIGLRGTRRLQSRVQ